MHARIGVLRALNRSVERTLTDRKARIQAIAILLDRGWGPTLTMNVSGVRPGYQLKAIIPQPGCNTHQTVALDIVRRPKATPVHELERYMRCRQCSEVRGYYKRSHLVALRRMKISASDPPSTWWPGER